MRAKLGSRVTHDVLHGVRTKLGSRVTHDIFGAARSSEGAGFPLQAGNRAQPSKARRLAGRTPKMRGLQDEIPLAGFISNVSRC